MLISAHVLGDMFKKDEGAMTNTSIWRASLLGATMLGGSALPGKPTHL